MTESKTRKTRAVIRKVGDNVRVGSAFGISMPLEDTGIELRFDFWHERDAKDGTLTEIRRVAGLIDEFNQAECSKRMENLMRIVKRVLTGEEDEDEDKPKGTAKDRARRRDLLGG